MSSNRPSDEVTGHVALAFPSNYITAADLRGGNVTVTIDRIIREKVTMEGGKSETKIVIRMLYPNGNRIEKGWILNKTNAKLIAAIHGPMVDAWPGRKVTIWPTTCKGAQGNIVDCIRVRGRVDASESAAKVPDGMAASAKGTEAPNPDGDGR